MAIISFAKTVKEYKAGIKFCTRRAWSDKQFNMWCKFFDEGKLIHDAWDKSPRNGGKKIGQFKLTCRPYKELLVHMPLSDLKAEGSMCNSMTEFCHLIGKSPLDEVTVIWFKPLPGVE